MLPAGENFAFWVVLKPLFLASEVSHISENIEFKLGIIPYQSNDFVDDCQVFS